jgi:hypothetical protein
LWKLPAQLLLSLINASAILVKLAGAITIVAILASIISERMSSQQ